MEFHAQWITTEEFAALRPINIFHKELDGTQISESPIRNRHVRFRKKISFSGEEKVTMDISADDYYKLYINGVFVTQGPAPAYVEDYQYNHLEITPYIRRGENIFAVQVYYHGEITRSFDSGDNRQGLIADIYADGAYLCGTDETWRYHTAEEYGGMLTSPHRTQFLENIDFRKKEDGWKEGEFEEKGWMSAVALSRYPYRFREQPVPCVSTYRVKPEKIVCVEKGKWFFDFGTELTGSLYGKIQGTPGQTVRILCSEEVLEEEPLTVRVPMRCNTTYDETCILSGGEDELEFFDYKAFRYVNVLTECENFVPEAFCALVRHHHFTEKCSLVSKVKWAEDIWKLCVNTLKWGTQEGFLDCPSREKGQYLGDFTVSGLAYLYVTGDAESYRKTLFDFADTSKVCKGLLSVAPGSLMQEIADFSLQYPLQVMAYYHYTKDLETLKRLYPVVCGVLDHFAQYEREDGLLVHVDDKWNLIDWPANLRDGYDLPGEEHESGRPCHNVLNAHYIGALYIMKEIQEILGLETDDKTERLKEAFLKAFYDNKKKIFYDREGSINAALHSNVLPVFYGFAPEESWENITSLIMEKGLCCGTQFSYFVLKALGRMGAYEKELALLLNEGEHSWVNMLREGATTCFEAWGKEQKWNTSLCHPWSCAPIIVLIEDIQQKYPEQIVIKYHQDLRDEV